MSKELFALMREREILTNNFLPTKKEIQKFSKDFITEIINSGNYNIQEKYCEVRRLKEAVDVMEIELKKSLPDENFEAYGIKATYRGGGSIANYDEDDVYASLKKKMDSRKTLLDASLKSDEAFYDSDGVIVPKVSKTERKSSLAVSF